MAKGSFQSLDKKMQNDQMVAEAITNDELICSDCLVRIEDKAGVCETFPCGKPKCVFEEGRCPEYVKE